MKKAFPLGLVLLGTAACLANESLAPLQNGVPPKNLSEYWGGYDPKLEPLEVEITKEWEQEGVVCRVVRYKIGTFKGNASRMAAFFAFPKGAQNLPALLHLHGGGQSASLDTVLTDAKRGYVSLSLNWGGNKMVLGKDTVYEGPKTDWGALDATHPPQRNKTNHFAGGIGADEFTLDAVESPRNSNWLMVVLAARRALTFLQQQPEVDGERLGVYGHSMGGRLTTQLTGIDKRVKAAVPSCGGSGDLLASSSEVPGGSRSKVSDLELACVSENPYIQRITAPTLWLSPTNDFHAHIDNMAYTWKDVPDSLLRLSISPHFNHRHSPENAITQHLWFEEHLKGLFKMPNTPKVVLNLKTSDGIPEILVSPDTALPVKAVNIYYSTDPHELTRFWRDAKAKENGGQWTASAPVLNTEDPIFAFANVFYETPEKYRDLPQSPGGANTAVFSLSSRERYATPEQLKTAGVKTSDAPERLIDDGERGWHDWYRLNWGNSSLWSVTTRKVKDIKWRGPDGARLAFEVNPKTDATLVVKVTSNEWGAFSNGPKAEYYAKKSLRGDATFQTVSVSLEEFIPTDSKHVAPLANWQTLTDLTLSPSVTLLKDGQKVTLEAKPWKDPLLTQVRNLRWEGGQYPAVQIKSNALNEEQHRKSFNDAIKRSLDQEKLDKK